MFENAIIPSFINLLEIDLFVFSNIAPIATIEGNIETT